MSKQENIIGQVIQTEYIEIPSITQSSTTLSCCNSVNFVPHVHYRIQPVDPNFSDIKIKKVMLWGNTESKKQYLLNSLTLSEIRLWKFSYHKDTLQVTKVDQYSFNFAWDIFGLFS
jgi:hypothetical protein